MTMMRRCRGFKLYTAIGLALMAVLLMSSASAAETSCGFSTQRLQCGDFACDKEGKICIACRADNDCYPGAMRCDATSGKCKMRSFTSLFGARTILAMLGAFVVCSIAVLAGVGGGGILVPMFCGLMEIPMQSAVGMSQSTICGQSTLNMYLIIRQKHPDSSWDRPLINYQYLSLLLPPGLIGTLIGGILSKLCPDVLRLILLLVLLSVVLYRSWETMKKQYRQDTDPMHVTVEANDANATSHRESYDGNGKSQSRELTETAGGAKKGLCEDIAVLPTPEQSPPPIERPPQSQYLQQELSMNIACFLVLLLFNIFRTYTVCGGFLYWLCVLVPVAFLSVVFYFNREKLRKLTESDPAQMTFTWTQRNSVTYPMVAVLAGGSAAMLGIGGGLVLGFVLNEVGIVPQEASATGGMATFFIAFSSALHLLITGSLVVDFSVVFCIVGLCSSALGQLVIMNYIKRRGLSYLIIGSLVFVVGGSLVALGGYGIYNAVISTQAGGSVLAFGRFCARAK
ncbi:Sulfite exporter TauE/SafE, putative [Leishmania donovani]|uniref:Sulfite exporter TauE/SafE, putative n=1 Tax=Leishmania donovani TaxID=5661 RepID=A0A3Q8IGK2_LEIDO|nr:Sulfite exporter TauE/SafE, putative [Leishmania donovani]